jgi:hypothetical protein
LIDRPAVVPLAAGALAPYGERARLVTADLLACDPPGGHDAALLCNVLHLYDEPSCARLVQRAARAVAPGGQVILKDLRIDEDRAGPPTALYFALNMALYTDGGNVHPTTRLCAWLSQAGLGEPIVETVAAAPDHVVVRARKP